MSRPNAPRRADSSPPVILETTLGHRHLDLVPFPRARRRLPAGLDGTGVQQPDEGMSGHLEMRCAAVLGMASICRYAPPSFSAA
jgi:hypothetical protein